MAATMSAIAEPPAVLRIRIPPFEEIHEDFHIPHWPAYPAKATKELMSAIDYAYVKALTQLAESCANEDDKAEIFCELFTYLYHRSTLLATNTSFRESVRAKALNIHINVTYGAGISKAWDGDLQNASSRLIRIIDRLDMKSRGA
jgi:hypothetical protein